MDLSGIIEHMNEHHADSLNSLVEAHTGTAVKNARMASVDAKGMHINYEQTKTVRIDFPSECTDRDGVKNAIISLCRQAQSTPHSVHDEIDSFKQEQASVIIASVNQEGNAVSSYAPLIRYKGDMYIYISEVADHYASISSNPDRVQILFIEDETKTKNLIARRRLTYRIKAHFVERETAEFEDILDILESGERMSGVNTIRKMKDFHLVRLEPTEGRYVKGFGQAYDIDASGNISHVGAGAASPATGGHRYEAV